MKKIKIYIDMDGVVAEWFKLATEEMTHTPGYFLNRTAEKNAVEFVDMLYEKGWDVSFLTAVYIDDHSKKDKEDWARKTFRNPVPIRFVPFGENKFNYVKEDPDTLMVLIDDFGKNLRDWEKAGHLPIKFFNKVNREPKFELVDGIMRVQLDSWEGYSIDYRMSAQQMYIVATSIALEEAKGGQIA